MADPTCDLCGAEAKSFSPRGRRCLACLAADDPALRSDVPVREPDTYLAGGMVWQHPHRLGGQPCFAGTRLTLAAIWSYLDRGYEDAFIVSEYPQLTTAMLDVARAFPRPPPPDTRGVRVDEDGCCTTCGRDVVGCYACDYDAQRKAARPGSRFLWRLIFAEIARAEAVRHGTLNAAAGRAIAESMDVVLLDRYTRARDILERHGDIGGAAALRALRGEE